MKWEIGGTPYKVQTEALRLAEGREGFAYFMEQGLGKTAVVLSEFMSLYRQGKVQGLVVICPNSLKTNWMKEADQWGVKDVHKFVWPEKIQMKNHQDPFIFTINFEALQYSGGGYLDQILDWWKCFGVIDESIGIKNPQATRTKFLLRHSKRFPYRRVLSGAPMTQSPLDLWAQLKFIGELYGVKSYAFRNTYCLMGGWMGKQFVGTQNEAKLQDILGACAFVAKKKDWTDLPEKMYATRFVEMTAEQKTIYKQMADDFVTMVNGEEVTALMAITQLMKLQQIACGFLYTEEGQTEWIMPPKDNPKLQATLDICAGNEGASKTVIFATHRASIELLAGHVPNCVVLRGQMTQSDIEAAKAKFNMDNNYSNLIAQTHATKYGHTLLGTEKRPCHTTVFFENDYSLDARLQAEDRNHRHGQHFPVTYIDISASPIDAHAIAALQKKQHVAHSIVGALQTLDKPPVSVVG